MSVVGRKVTGTAIVVDHLRLVLKLVEFLRHVARADARSPAGRKGHHDGHRLSGETCAMTHPPMPKIPTAYIFCRIDA